MLAPIEVNLLNIRVNAVGLSYRFAAFQNVSQQSELADGEEKPSAHIGQGDLGIVGYPEAVHLD